MIATCAALQDINAHWSMGRAQNESCVLPATGFYEEKKADTDLGSPAICSMYSVNVL